MADTRDRVLLELERGRMRNESPESRCLARDKLPALSQTQIAERFVEYIREIPYRLLRTSLPDHSMQWGESVCGWEARLGAYEWNGANWDETKKLLDTSVIKLTKLESNPQASAAADIYEEIRNWGNPRGRQLAGGRVLELLEPLWKRGAIDAVDSTLTKLYSLARPTRFIIYDSRVARAILTIAEDIFRVKTVDRISVDTVDLFNQAFPHLGLYNGTGGTRQRGYRWRQWPAAYGIVGAQYDANKLCGLMVDILNESPESQKAKWSLREVEAVLFMAGY